MRTLILTLPAGRPSDGVACESVLTDDSGAVLRASESPLALLPKPQGEDVVALVPLRQLAWHRVTLPRGTLGRGYFQDGKIQRLRAVLDGLLEDQLLDEPAELHMALAPGAQAEQACWVAVCDRAWLDAWLTALDQAGLPVNRIVPELAPAADAPTPSLSVIGSAEHAWLVQNSEAGLRCLPLNPATVSLLEPTAGPSPAPLLAEPAVAELAEQLFKRPVTLQSRAQRAALAAQGTWDLAQFDLLRTRQARSRQKALRVLHTLWHAPMWRPARWALLALLGVQLVGLNVQAYKVRSHEADLKADIQSVLRATFPEVNVVVDAPTQMARALAEQQHSRGGMGAGDLETLLTQLDRAAPGFGGAKGLSYEAGELRLQGLSAQAAPMNGVIARLQTQGLGARWDQDTLVLSPESRP